MSFLCSLFHHLPLDSGQVLQSASVVEVCSTSSFVDGFFSYGNDDGTCTCHGAKPSCSSSSFAYASCSSYASGDDACSAQWADVSYFPPSPPMCKALLMVPSMCLAPPMGESSSPTGSASRIVIVLTTLAPAFLIS